MSATQPKTAFGRYIFPLRDAWLAKAPPGADHRRRAADHRHAPSSLTSAGAAERAASPWEKCRSSAICSMSFWPDCDTGHNIVGSVFPAMPLNVSKKTVRRI